MVSLLLPLKLVCMPSCKVHGLDHIITSIVPVHVLVVRSRTEPRVQMRSDVVNAQSKSVETFNLLTD